MVISNLIRSWLLLIPLIPSIIVSIFNIYHFLRDQALRTALHNHAIILLLIFGLILEVTDISWQIYYYRIGNVLVETSAFCLSWVFTSSSIYIIIYLLMAWASIERHILIFHSNWFATKTKRFCFHYLPLVICILCPTIFYFLIFFILPCDMTFQYDQRLCTLYSCVLNNSTTSLWDSIVNFIMPAFIIVIFSIALLVRVLYHRYRIRRRIEWRNYKKLAIQLLPISTLYILLQFPPITLYAAYSAGLSYNIAADYFSDALFFTAWVILLTPFACIMSLPDLKAKCRNLVLFWRRRRVVVPTILQMTRLKGGEAVATVPTIQ